MATAPGSYFATLSATAAITERLSALPAVATIDWADQAASCLTPIATGGRVVLMICSVDPSGVVLSQEAVGVAVAADPASEDAESVDSMELMLRSRADRLQSLGFRPNEQILASGLVAPLSKLVEGSDWRQGGLGQIWSSTGTDDVVFGFMRLGTAEFGRIIMVQIGISGRQATMAHVGLLRSTLPLLVRRTLLAVGVKRSTTSRWLTQREQQVLNELALGKSVREIADLIERSPHTVHDHVKSLHRKLNASSRGELVSRALGFLDEQGKQRDQAESPTIAADRITTLLHEAVASEAQAKPGMMKAQPLHRGDIVVNPQQQQARTL